MDTQEKVRENRLRRMAKRQGLVLIRARRRDPRAEDFGRYWLVDAERNIDVAGRSYGLSIDEIENWLTDDERIAKQRRGS